MYPTQKLKAQIPNVIIYLLGLAYSSKLTALNTPDVLKDLIPSPEPLFVSLTVPDFSSIVKRHFCC
eukprot:02173.XXX_7431_7625_1 [CDS] Oithona nana genome sequencing.